MQKYDLNGYAHRRQTKDRKCAIFCHFKDGKPVATIGKGDSIIFANFRPDRARMITRSFIYQDFNGFERKQDFLAPTFVSMTQYDVTF